MTPPRGRAWGEAHAPTLEDIRLLGESAFATLPAEFRTMSGDVVILVEDFATDDVLSSLGIESEYDLLGLYQGVNLVEGGVNDGLPTPNMVILYRRPILDYWAEYEESLGAIVTHVLVHEIGHHFGLSDDDMAAIEARADEGDP
jgi:predicted Zn-dependent protease with MMP-like domain